MCPWNYLRNFYLSCLARIFLTTNYAANAADLIAVINTMLRDLNAMKFTKTCHNYPQLWQLLSYFVRCNRRQRTTDRTIIKFVINAGVLWSISVWLCKTHTTAVQHLTGSKYEIHDGIKQLIKMWMAIMRMMMTIAMIWEIDDSRCGTGS